MYIESTGRQGGKCSERSRIARFDMHAHKCPAPRTHCRERHNCGERFAGEEGAGRVVSRSIVDLFAGRCGRFAIEQDGS